MKAEISEVLAHLRSISGNVPLHRMESKRGYSFSARPFAEQLAIWDHLWRTENHFWTRVHAFFFLEKHMKKEASLRQMWPVIVGWQNQVDDWGLCDALAKLYTRILELMPDEVYRQLQEWNTDPDLWKRRQSVVSLLYYSRTKKQYLPFEKITALLTPLITDREYYVQKGVGWALRELYNIYPAQALAYLKEHLADLSGAVLATATEKMDPALRGDLKAMRAPSGRPAR
jgi:3-methyladenine DNA glycosylase AlkD